MMSMATFAAHIPMRNVGTCSLMVARLALRQHDIGQVQSLSCLSKPPGGSLFTEAVQMLTRGMQIRPEGAFEQQAWQKAGMHMLQVSSMS